MTDDFPPIEDEPHPTSDISQVPLIYTSRPLPTVQRVGGGWQIVIAFTAGSALSLLAYVLPGGPLLILAVKFIAGITFLCIRGQRGYGAGLLLSIAVGFIIFFYMCAANFKI